MMPNKKKQSQFESDNLPKHAPHMLCIHISQVVSYLVSSGSQLTEYQVQYTQHITSNNNISPT